MPVDSCDLHSACSMKSQSYTFDLGLRVYMVLHQGQCVSWQHPQDIPFTLGVFT